MLRRELYYSCLIGLCDVYFGLRFSKKLVIGFKGLQRVLLQLKVITNARVSITNALSALYYLSSFGHSYWNTSALLCICERETCPSWLPNTAWRMSRINFVHQSLIPIFYPYRYCALAVDSQTYTVTLDARTHQTNPISVYQRPS